MEAVVGTVLNRWDTFVEEIKSPKDEGKKEIEEEERRVDC